MSVENGQGNTDANGSADAELSLREEIVKNLADLKADDDGADGSAAAAAPPAAAPAANADPAADAGAEKTEGAAASAESTPATPTEPKTKVPQSWSAADRQLWDKVPPEVQAVIARREEEAHKGIVALGQDAAFGKKMNEAISPYLPIIRAEGGEPVRAVQDLLQTAYVLRTANADQKVQLFRQLAGQFGVDLSAAAQAAPQVDPHVQQLEREIAQLKGHLVAGQAQQHQQVEEQAQAVIDAFAADPKNEFYETVKPLMGQLLVSGQASTMQEAYDKACWANSDVRSTLLGRQQAEAEAKRAAEAKAKADAKRKASGSISGSPGTVVPTTITANQNLSLRDELRAQFRAATSS